MRTIQELLDHLAQSDIQLRVEGTQIRYSAPPGALNAGLKEEIRCRKPELLDFLRSPARSTGCIPRIPEGTPPMLSFAQERLWVHSHFDGLGACYHLPFGLELSGRLEVGVLKEALRSIALRHQILRTTFRVLDGSPVPHVSQDANLDIRLIDLRSVSTEKRAETLRQSVDEEIRKPFDLAQGPLVRTVLLQIQDTLHHFLVVSHHIVADEWSIGIFLQEIATFYRSIILGLKPPLEEPPIQYCDYAAWQRQWLKGAVLEEQIGFWREQLAGAPATLRLPTDRPRPSLQSYQGSNLRFQLDENLSRQLRLLARKGE